MSNEQMRPLLKAWFQARRAAPPDVPVGVAQVLTRVAQTRQRGRWLPLPVLHRKAQAKPPTTNEMIEFQPSPILATNGRAPIVIGRTQTMFSPVKAIIGGAFVFAVGGLFLIAQPFDQESRVPGAATDAVDPGPAAYVGGFMREGYTPDDEDVTNDDDGNRLTLRGSVMTGTMEMDDQRLSGGYELTLNIDEFPQPDTDVRVEVHWGELTITNGGGDWSGTWRSTYDASQSEEAILGVYDLIGAGEYEGLSALLSPTGGWEELPGLPLAGAIYPSPQLPAE